MTATVETVSEQLDLAAIMPPEKVVSAIARSITLSDADVGKNFIGQLLSYLLIHNFIFHNNFSYGHSSSSKTTILWWFR